MEIKKETIEQYHAHPALSGSGIKALLRSPAHYKHEYIDGNHRKETPALRFGSIIHSAVLEPRRFFLNCLEAPEVNKRTKAGKEEYAEWEAKCVKPNSIILNKDDIEKINGIIESVKRNPMALELISNGVAENSIYFTHPLYGIECKVRPDWLRDDRKIVDLKTTLCANYEEFKMQSYRLGYHIQAAWNTDAVEAAFDTKVHSFNSICVEKSEPYCNAVYLADEAMITKGRNLITQAIEVYQRCKEHNLWPGYQWDWNRMRYRAENMSVPPFAFYDEEFENQPPQ